MHCAAVFRTIDPQRSVPARLLTGQIAVGGNFIPDTVGAALSVLLILYARRVLITVDITLSGYVVPRNALKRGPVWS